MARTTLLLTGSLLCTAALPGAVASPPRIVRPKPAPATELRPVAATASAAAQIDADAVLPPARRRLLAVPLPRLDSLESPVAQQIRDVQRSFADLVANAGVTDTAVAEGYGSLGQVYHAYEFLDAAEACYRNATRLTPDDFRWLHLLGYLFQQSGRLEEAVPLYTAARAARPDDHVARLYVGDVYLRLNRLPEARAQFQATVGIFPAAAFDGLGHVALLEGRLEEAVAHFEAALQRVPESGPTHYSLAMAYRGLGRLDLAESHLRRVGPGGIRPVDPLVDNLQDLLRGERVHVIQGRLAYQSGEFKAAAEAFARAVDAAPASVDARVNLGAALAQTGDLSGAIRQLEAALGLDSRSVATHRSLGAALAHVDRHGEAVDHLRVVTELAPDDIEARRLLAGSLSRLGREVEAIEVLFSVTSLDPGDEDSLLSLTFLLADRARYREARDLVDRAHQLFPARPRTTTTLARLLATSPDVTLRDGSRALDLAVALFDADPTPVHRETVVMSLAELGRCGEAATWLQRAVDDARRGGDAELAARLEGEKPRYERGACRPGEPGP